MLNLARGYFSEKVAREKSFQPLIEKEVKGEKQSFVKFNKLIIDNMVYMFDYENNTVKVGSHDPILVQLSFQLFCV